MADLTILGSGVSGLTSAITLLEHGYDVQIVTKEKTEETTSAVAGAIWFPYEARPFKKVNAWSLESFNKFKALSKDASTGISMIDYAIILNTSEKPWWLQSIPPDHIISDSVSGFYNKDYSGYIVNIPLIETPVYLPWLVNHFKSLGGSFSIREISDLDELNEFDLAINCTGLGAKKLFGDTEMYPIQGQVVRVSPDSSVRGMATDFHFGKNSEEMAYIIPRKDGIILGGSARLDVDSIKPDPEFSSRIIDYNSEYEQKLKELPVLETKVGLRPGRSEIRLEKDPNFSVVHNYGHGGAGYTVSWGCANSVLELVRKSLS
ncbi:MAG: FAD-binding oxidoreductase [Balneolaceae bacterium]|nr:FAD-binding oxidoreductase [Balneolaceae bacterium]MBO6547674.1 FAD-binding oxidoreductase [Balneolaceae bacterium]MBO6648185.1 FAD-binding oxidoreductase [Balneolaceae bacterium]